METTNAWTVLVSSKEPGALGLVERLGAAGISAARRDIELCDVAFVTNGKTYVHAELKNHRDFLASISTDCRYQEQTASMAEALVPFTFYLLQGYTAPPRTADDEQRKIQHALTRLQLSSSIAAVTALPEISRKRTHIAAVPLTTKDGLYEWIVYVHKNLVDAPELTDGVFAPLCDNVKHNYGTKPANRDQRRVYVEQLCRVTGIAEEKAKAIAIAYPSLRRLLEFLQSATDAKALVEAFRDLKVGMAHKGVENLYKQLLAPDEQRIQTWGRKRARSPQQPPGVGVEDAGDAVFQQQDAGDAGP